MKSESDELSLFFSFVPMEQVVYILHSEKHNKIYIGCTSNLIARFHSHNKLSNKGWTKRYRPWRVIYIESFSDKKDAFAREKFLKSGKGREFIHHSILPEIL